MKMAKKSCDQCGTEIPCGVAPCSVGGRGVLAEAEGSLELKAVSNSGDGDKSFPKASSKSGLMQTLIVLLWTAIFFMSICSAVTCFDVSMYFDSGRCAYVAWNICWIFMFMWLAIAIGRRKSWARKSYIVLMAPIALIALCCAPLFLSVVCSCFSRENSAAGNLFVATDNLLVITAGICVMVIVILLTCLCLLFTKKVRIAFEQDAGLKGARAVANRWHCFLYWLFVVMLLVGFDVQKCVHYGSEGWVSDCKKAAEQGYVKAQLLLGVCYADGDGVTQDKAEAEKWFRKAAEQGDAQGQFHLGVCYAAGDGVAQDMAEAVRWFHKAAERGCVKAQCVLGACYAAGEGVAQNKAEAVKWFRKATDR